MNVLATGSLHINYQYFQLVLFIIILVVVVVVVKSNYFLLTDTERHLVIFNSKN